MLHPHQLSVRLLFRPQLLQAAIPTPVCVSTASCSPPRPLGPRTVPLPFRMAFPPVLPPTFTPDPSSWDFSLNSHSTSHTRSSYLIV